MSSMALVAGRERTGPAAKEGRAAAAALAVMAPFIAEAGAQVTPAPLALLGNPDHRSEDGDRRSGL